MLTVAGQRGQFGARVQQHAAEEPSHARARALTRLHKTAGLIVLEQAPNNRIVTLKDVQVNYSCFYDNITRLISIFIKYIKWLTRRVTTIFDNYLSLSALYQVIDLKWQLYNIFNLAVANLCFLPTLELLGR